MCHINTKPTILLDHPSVVWGLLISKLFSFHDTFKNEKPKVILRLFTLPVSPAFGPLGVRLEATEGSTVQGSGGQPWARRSLVAHVTY